MMPLLIYKKYQYSRAEAFLEAKRGGPKKTRGWVGLVGGSMFFS